jgi:hypothetical protein
MPTGVPTSPPPPDDPNTTFTIASGTFDLAPGREAYKCQNFKNPLDRDVAITVTESTMVKGSHHMFVFHGATFNQNTNGVADCSGVEFHDYLHVAQTPHEVISCPAGVGRILKKGEGLRILAHYLNTTGDPITGQITIKFRFVETNQVQFLAAQMFLNNAGLLVPAGKSTQTRTFNVPYDIKMLYAVSHMHSRGTRFQARTNTGQVIYDGPDWDEPKENVFTPPMDVKAGSTITWSCDFANNTGRTLIFGESADVNEMCILNALFYPPTPGQHEGQALDTNF